MSGPAALAYGYARARARKSRIIPAAVLVGLVTADQPALTIPGWRDVEDDHDAAALVSLLYPRLIDDYVTMIRAYPAARRVLLALARLHELENVKLAWRAALGSIPPAQWRDCWRPMGALETISRMVCEATSSPRHVARAFVGTPYETIAKVVSSAHPGDLAAAEIAFDRWGSRELADATRALPESEGAARDLLWRIVRERDTALMERAVGPLGLAPESAVRMTTILDRGTRDDGRRCSVAADWDDGAVPTALRSNERIPRCSTKPVRRSSPSCRACSRLRRRRRLSGGCGPRSRGPCVA